MELNMTLLFLQKFKKHY